MYQIFAKNASLSMLLRGVNELTDPRGAFPPTCRRDSSGGKALRRVQIGKFLDAHSPNFLAAQVFPRIKCGEPKRLLRYGDRGLEKRSQFHSYTFAFRPSKHNTQSYELKTQDNFKETTIDIGTLSKPLPQNPWTGLFPLLLHKISLHHHFSSDLARTECQLEVLESGSR